MVKARASGKEYRNVSVSGPTQSLEPESLTISRAVRVYFEMGCGEV